MKKYIYNLCILFYYKLYMYWIFMCFVMYFLVLFSLKKVLVALKSHTSNLTFSPGQESPPTQVRTFFCSPFPHRLLQFPSDAQLLQTDQMFLNWYNFILQKFKQALSLQLSAESYFKVLLTRLVSYCWMYPIFIVSNVRINTVQLSIGAPLSKWSYSSEVPVTRVFALANQWASRVTCENKLCFKGTNIKDYIMFFFIYNFLTKTFFKRLILNVFRKLFLMIKKNSNKFLIG